MGKTKKKTRKKESVGMKKKKQAQRNKKWGSKKTENGGKNGAFVFQRKKKHKTVDSGMLLGVVEVLALHGTDELVDVIAGCVADVDGDAAQTAWRGLDALFAFDHSHWH